MAGDRIQGEKPKSFEVCEQAERYLDNHIAEIVKIYGGRWVIIHSGHVVDSDLSELELAKRAEGRGRFDLRYATPMFPIPKTVEEYLELKREQEGGELARFESHEVENLRGLFGLDENGRI